jgi:hypothetical protein
MGRLLGAFDEIRLDFSLFSEKFFQNAPIQTMKEGTEYRPTVYSAVS